MLGITTRTMYLCAKLISGYLGLLMDTAGRAESATTHRTGWDGPSAEPSGRIDILILPEIRLNAQMDVYCHSTQLAIIQFPGCVIKLLRLVPGTGQLGWAGIGSYVHMFYGLCTTLCPATYSYTGANAGRAILFIYQRGDCGNWQSCGCRSRTNHVVCCN